MGKIDIAIGCLIYFFELINTYSGLISALVSVGALIVAVRAIRISTEDNRTQVIVGKCEEIYELLSSTVVEYDLLQKLYCSLQQYHNNLNDISSLTRDYFEDYKVELDRIKSIIDTEELFKKLIRLNVLSNAYLDEPLMFEVNAYSNLFQELLITTIQAQLITDETDFKEGFPTNEKFYQFTKKIAHKLITKISLGTKTVDSSKFDNYLQNDFKKAIGLK